MANYDGPISFNKEVSEVRWIRFDELEKWMKDKPTDFTGPFIEALSIYQRTKSTKQILT